MTFEKETTENGALIPHAAMELAGLPADGELEMIVSRGAVILLRKRMTAMELVETISALGKQTTRLISHLKKVCGDCDDCGDFDEDDCPFDQSEYVDLPDFLRAEAGIPKDAKLCACPNEEAGTVTVYPAEHSHDLRDVPPGLLAALRRDGLCLGELEEHLIAEDVVYG